MKNTLGPSTLISASILIPVIGFAIWIGTMGSKVEANAQSFIKVEKRQESMLKVQTKNHIEIISRLSTIEGYLKKKGPR